MGNGRRTTPRPELLLDDLQTLLQEQLKRAREGNMGEFEVLTERADALVQEIAKARILELPQFESRLKQLRQLYDSLCLAVTAQRADISEKLSRVRTGRRTIGVYRTST